MSGRWSVSTRTGMKRSRTIAATRGSAYVVRSISWHAPHHAAVIDSSTGLRSRAARENAPASHSSHSIIFAGGFAPPHPPTRSLARRFAGALRSRGSLATLASNTQILAEYNIRMLALRYVALVALVVWVGGLIALGAIAAPAIFDVVGAQPIADGRLLAGATFGEILRRFTLVSYGAGILLLGTLVVRAILGPRPRRFAWRAALATVMLATTAYAGIVVAGRIRDIQREIHVAPSSLPENDPRRIEFGRLHGLSTSLQLVPLVGGLALMYWELKE